MTQNELKELFEYKDGSLIWKISRGNRAKIGSVAGSYDNSTKYRQVRLNKKKFYIHRLIWIYHYGEIENIYQVDHKDRNRLNNNIENLRLLTEKQNKTNVTGVGAYKVGKKYMSLIGIDGRSKYLGIFKNKEDAKNKYNEHKKLILGAL